MAIEVKVPDIGDFKDVPVIEIHVKPGDTIKAEDPLLTLESDKATMDVPADRDGTVEAVLVKVGDQVSEGTRDPHAQGRRRRGAGDPAALGDRPAGAGARTQADRGSCQPSPRPLPAAAGAGAVHASPSVRRLARELEVDLAKVKGTGEKGRITKDDVKAFLRGPAAPAPAAAAAPSGGMGIPEIPAQDFSEVRPDRDQAAGAHQAAVRAVPAPRLAQRPARHPQRRGRHHRASTPTARNSTPPPRSKGYRVTLLAFLMKASVSALKAFPEFNSSLSPDKDALILKNYYNIGIAVDTPDGLVVPVVKDVDRKGIVELSKELGAVSKKARDGKLGPADMQGGTFTISCLGGIGGTGFTPIVNAPEVAILGVVRSKMAPVWNGKEFEPRLMLPLYVSYDHRVIDGALAARFTRHLCHVLEDVRRLVL